MRDDVRIVEAAEDDVRRFVSDQYHRRHLLVHLGERRGILLFAFRGAVFLGHLFLRLAPAEEQELRSGLPGVPLLQHLRVMDEHQRAGVGRRLIGAAERRLRAMGHRRVALGVHPANDDAIRLYRRLSFTEWREQTLMTFREDVGDDGRVVREEEPFLVFVKRLDRPPPG
ncbi:GNAT family N-acetyltransferase [Actinoplanes sp. TBRC 11911]|uniref:GNAT family N-acetyltransferase n=1 Tax=Actinoplanes sp. TBRC 11911 TaxID=2729386 RepID=UPI00145D1601|nr:GNAT family N-acetyltransferase [Actinoplanes sp. TBRC 11911]NMO51281.1 GNAT family N-acetyltransferase [Actinoplanes sp. TBRC 11911]